MLEKYDALLGYILSFLVVADYFYSLYAYWMCQTFDALLYAIYAVLFAVVLNGIKD